MTRPYHPPERDKPLTDTQRFTVGTRIGYAKAFLRNIATPATDDAWRRQGIVVAIGGELTPLYPHWKTGAAQVLPADLVLVQWIDESYPIRHEDGELQAAHSVRNGVIARIGSGRYAEDIP